MNRIALLEDHERMAALVSRALAAAGIETDVYHSISQATVGLEQIRYPALVVDRNLPDGDGLELVRKLRARRIDTPCLMLTARDALHDRISGLEAGADDYLPKPFSMEELVARVRALMRRAPQQQSLAPQHGDLRIDPVEGRMISGAESISLSPAELQLMLVLVRAAGATVRRTALEAAAWGIAEPVTPNALDVALHRLRRKLGGIDSRLQIANQRGLGYALKEHDAAA
ncbi:response regulator transcription factor [Herbaspirillum robiniae]|uniref:Response regulator transcription factor n=1 Tax=Herbaspirillum robiniae TaxID=2014887 RepID=A0A2D0B7D7_9BURK|nr:response regulator transcription factor [Herbaspirillum robiniae]NUU02937.1 response regulator transcription factor [Herbaspirillum robiniae]OWY30041.1 two-component system response regulator [Herbaspirillum robiniae]